MRDGKLLARGRLDHLADADDVAALVRREREPERRRLGQHVEHPAPGDVDRDRAQLRHLNDGIQMAGEGRDVPERDAPHLAAVHLGGDSHEAGRRVEGELGHGLGHLDHARLDQHRDDADRVRSGHGRILDLLHDHEAGVRLGVRGREDEVAVRRGIAARLAQHPQPQVVALVAEVRHLLEHRLARNVGDAAHDHPTRLAAGVRVNRLDRRQFRHPGASRAEAILARAPT